MSIHRWTGLLLGAAAMLMVPSASATDSDRPGMGRPGPWLEITRSEEFAAGDAAIAAIHERARVSLARILTIDTGH
jgi:hypothetical protein